MSITIEKLKDATLFEKYRPRTVGQMLLPSRLRTAITTMMTTGKVPNLILQSPSAGTGKTTAARAIASEMTGGDDYYYLNAALDNGKCDIQGVKDFCMTNDIMGNMKFVIFDEADGAGAKNFQEPLKALMENVANTARFILTCNDVSAIIPQIASRCVALQFTYEDEQDSLEMKSLITARLVSVCNREGFAYDAQTISDIVERHFPDMRGMFNSIQYMSNLPTGICGGLRDHAEGVDELVVYIKNGDFMSARRAASKMLNANCSIYRNMYDYLLPTVDDPVSLMNATLTTAEYAFRGTTTVDKEINVAAMIAALIKDIAK